MEELTLVLISILFSCLAFYIVISQFYSKPRNRNFSGSSRVLLVTAHPDDEVMFFGPTILSLLEAGCQVKVLNNKVWRWKVKLVFSQINTGQSKGVVNTDQLEMTLELRPLLMYNNNLTVYHPLLIKLWQVVPDGSCNACTLMHARV